MRRKGNADTAIPTLVPACSPLSTTQAGREKALDVGALDLETTCRGEMPGERHAPSAPSVPHHHSVTSMAAMPEA